MLGFARVTEKRIFSQVEDLLPGDLSVWKKDGETEKKHGEFVACGWWSAVIPSARSAGSSSGTCAETSRLRRDATWPFISSIGGQSEE